MRSLLILEIVLALAHLALFPTLIAAFLFGADLNGPWGAVFLIGIGAGFAHRTVQERRSRLDQELEREVLDAFD